jgi:hypothetical protein
MEATAMPHDTPTARFLALTARKMLHLQQSGYRAFSRIISGQTGL